MRRHIEDYLCSPADLAHSLGAPRAQGKVQRIQVPAAIFDTTSREVGPSLRGLQRPCPSSAPRAAAANLGSKRGDPGDRQSGGVVLAAVVYRRSETSSA